MKICCLVLLYSARVPVRALPRLLFPAQAGTWTDRYCPYMQPGCSAAARLAHTVPYGRLLRRAPCPVLCHRLFLLKSQAFRPPLISIRHVSRPPGFTSPEKNKKNRPENRAVIKRRPVCVYFPSQLPMGERRGFRLPMVITLPGQIKTGGAGFFTHTAIKYSTQT